LQSVAQRAVSDAWSREESKLAKQATSLHHLDSTNLCARSEEVQVRRGVTLVEQHVLPSALVAR
jgi:hypothetical protein